MTDDPRLAALAEALTDVQGGAYASWLKRTPLILATLAVAGWTLVRTECLIAEAFTSKPSDVAEIARLRKIEAAARTYLDDNTGAKRNALRAALAGGSE